MLKLSQVVTKDIMLSIIPRILGFLAISILAVPAFAQHSHGKGTLQLSLQADILQGQWTMPMEALLGFEQLPKNSSQTDAMTQLQKSLQNASYFIDLPAEAKCQQIEVKAESDMFQGVKGKGHSDLQYAFKFKCIHPQSLTKFGFPFFKSHLRAHQLKVEWVSNGAQKSATVRSSKPTFAL